MIKMERKLVTRARYDGHKATSADNSLALLASLLSSGTFTSRMSSVIAIANTPSLNDSRRPVLVVCNLSRVIASLVGAASGLPASQNEQSAFIPCISRQLQADGHALGLDLPRTRVGLGAGAADPSTDRARPGFSADAFVHRP